MHSRLVTRQFSKKTTSLAHPRNGAVLEPTNRVQPRGGWGQAKEAASRCARVCQNYPLANYPSVLPEAGEFFYLHQQLKKRGLWEGVVQEPLRRALFCVFLCSEVIFSCKSHRNFFQKLPLQCRHFLENPLAKNPKTQLLITVGVFLLTVELVNLQSVEVLIRHFLTASKKAPTVNKEVPIFMK